MDRILIFAKPESATSELVSTLARNGFDVLSVDSRAAVSAELDRRHVDLVLLDLDLRALDLAREVRAAHPATRVVLTGCVPFTERQLERLDCGAVAFLPKPFDLRRAAAFMRSHLTPLAYLRRLWHAEQPTSYAL
jgi:DNA-binding response OmpR family regulator